MNKRRTRIITVVNQKGGVGKTTITCNLAFAAAEAAHSVLVADFDTQGNTSQILLQDPDIYTRLGGTELFWADDLAPKDIPTHTSPMSPLISLIHGHTHLDAVDQGEKVHERAVAIRDQIRALPYDRIIFDTPPSIGPRQVAPMLWSDILIVPIEPTQLAILGIKELMKTIEKAKRVNRNLQVAFVINRFKSTSKVQCRMINELRAKFGSAIWGELPDRVAVADSLAEGCPAWRRGHAKNRIIWREFTQRAMAIEL